MKINYAFLIKNIIFGSVIATRAAASALPVNAPVEHKVGAWADVRREFATTNSELPLVNFDTWLANYSRQLPLREAMSESYASVPQSQWQDVDAHWVSYVRASGNASDAATYMEVRTQVGTTLQTSSAPNTREEFLNTWLVKAGCKTYEDESGNCGVGVGGGGGNGTGNEGGGNGP